MSKVLSDGVLYNEFGHPVCPADCPAHSTDKQIAAFQLFARQALRNYKASLACKPTSELTTQK